MSERIWDNQHDLSYAVPEEITGRLTDESWINESCPRFHSPTIDAIVLWVDHPDPELREMDCGSRFAIIIEKEYGDPDNRLILKTDDVGEALNKVVELEALGKDGVLALLD